MVYHCEVKMHEYVVLRISERCGVQLLLLLQPKVKSSATTDYSAPNVSSTVV